MNLLFLVGLTLSLTVAMQQHAIEGKWNTGQENTIVEIQKENGEYFGKIVSSDKVDSGTLILKDFKSDGDNWKAKLYSFKKEKWMNASLKMDDQQMLAVTVKAGLVSKSITWTKE